MMFRKEEQDEIPLFACARVRMLVSPVPTEL